MQQINNFKRSGIYLLLLVISLIIILSLIFLLICASIVLNVYSIKGIIDNSGYTDVKVNIINIKNSSLEMPNEMYYKYDFYFYYNDKIRNAPILCRTADCINIYDKYKINDNIIVYLHYGEFTLDKNVGSLIIYILTCVLNSLIFIMLSGFCAFKIIIPIILNLCKTNKKYTFNNINDDTSL